jgi:hypothetical protein
MHLDIGESRSPTQILQWNLVPASPQLWVYVYTFTLGLMDMMVMAMAKVMVIVMVIIYQKYLGKSVGYVNVSIKTSTVLAPSLSQSFYKIRVFHLPKAATNSEILICQKLPVEHSTPPEMWLSPPDPQVGSLLAGFQAGFHVGSHTGYESPAGSVCSGTIVSPHGIHRLKGFYEPKLLPT